MDRKRRKQPRRPKSRSPRVEVQSGRAGRPRNGALDAVRGLAIVLMIVDHIADMLFSVPIEPLSIRMVTRFSMPLFAILMGYFLAAAKPINWNRYLQLVFATVVVNIAYVTLRGQVEILASLLVCYTLFIAIGRHFIWLLPAAFLFPFDPSVGPFDYSLAVVASCVAQGMVLRRFGVRYAIPTACLLTLATLVVAAPTGYVLFFVVPATLLISYAANRPTRTVPGLQLVGRYPLSIYVAQYYVLIGLVAV